jgi:hypothetical protein
VTDAAAADERGVQAIRVNQVGQGRGDPGEHHRAVDVDSRVRRSVWQQVDPIPPENRIRQLTCWSSVHQAERADHLFEQGDHTGGRGCRPARVTVTGAICTSPWQVRPGNHI